MARDRVSPFLNTIAKSTSDVRSIVEALRIFGYINEIEYSELNTEITILQREIVRADGAETIELARRGDPADIPGMIPREY